MTRTSPLIAASVSTSIEITAAEPAAPTKPDPATPAATAMMFSCARAATSTSCRAVTTVENVVPVWESVVKPVFEPM